MTQYENLKSLIRAYKDASGLQAFTARNVTFFEMKSRFGIEKKGYIIEGFGFCPET